MSKIVYLKDYKKSTDGSLEDKIVVGSDIRPRQAVNLAAMNRTIQIVTNGFEENKVIKIKDAYSSFVENPAETLFGIDEDSQFNFQMKFFAHSKKMDFLLQSEQFLSHTHFRRVRDDMYLIADELFTNFSKAAKDQTKSMRLNIAANNDTVAIYCRDNFGTLNPKDMIDNMQRCFDKGVVNAINKDENAGAGIGSYLMYTLGTGMIISVEPGKGSLVLIWMPRSKHHEDRIDMNKSLIIIEIKES